MASIFPPALLLFGIYFPPSAFTIERTVLCGGRLPSGPVAAWCGAGAAAEDRFCSVFFRLTFTAWLSVLASTVSALSFSVWPFQSALCVASTADDIGSFFFLLLKATSGMCLFLPFLSPSPQ